MRILLTGGGSGGHVFPLIAVARKLTEADSQAELLFVGPDKGSAEIFRNENIRANTIFAGKIRRYISPLALVDFLKLPIGFLQSYWYIFWFMPDVVFSKGGYGSALPTLVCWLFRIPIILHESDSVPGFANRIISKLARRTFVAFDQAYEFFPKTKTSVVGNPVREELFSRNSVDAKSALNIKSEKPTIFIMGGSQGARQINGLLLLLAPELVDKYEVVHQCGEKNFKKVNAGIKLQLRDSENKELYHLYPVLSEQEMASAYQLASVIVSRAGSGAIFEIAASGKPSILIPYLDAVGDHQSKNAKIYKETGAALVLRGKNIMPHMLMGLIDKSVNNPEQAQKMSRAAHEFAKPDAASKIAEEILAITSS